MSSTRCSATHICGKTDQAVGKVKQVAEKAIDKIEQAAKEVRK